MNIYKGYVFSVITRIFINRNKNFEDLNNFLTNAKNKYYSFYLKDS